MTYRKSILFLTILIILCMGAAGLIISMQERESQKAEIFESQTRTETVIEADQAWSYDIVDVSSANLTDITGDDNRDVFLQNSSGFVVLNGDGRSQLEVSHSPLFTNLTDLTGDNVVEIIALTLENAQVKLIAYQGDGSILWETAVPTMNQFERITSIQLDEDAVPDIVVGNLSQVVAVSGVDGSELWSVDLGLNDTIRGLDDLRSPDGNRIAVAYEGGEILVLDRFGEVEWFTTALQGTRRTRGLSLAQDDVDNLFVGSVSGQLEVLTAAGESLWRAQLGDPVNEIRVVEADGKRATAEVVAGTKDGRVEAYSSSGQLLWGFSLTDKITEISEGFIRGDTPVTVIGDDSGVVVFVDSNGQIVLRTNHAGTINRIDSGSLSDRDGVLVVDGFTAQFSQINSVEKEFVETIGTGTYTDPGFQIGPVLGSIFGILITVGGSVWLPRRLPNPPMTFHLDRASMLSLTKKAKKQLNQKRLNTLAQLQGGGQPSINPLKPQKERLL